VKKGAGFWVVVVLMVAGAAGFFVWRKFIAKHTAQFSIQAQGCKGKLEVEALAFRDGETLFKKTAAIESDAAGAARWSSGDLKDRAGTQKTDSGQVSCTAMVGN